MLQELQKSIDQMTTPNPATLQKIRNTQMEGDQAHQEEIMSQQATEEQRQQRAQSAAEAARIQQIHDLTGTLQGLPGGTNSSLDLRPEGTPFFGLGAGVGDAPPSGLNIEELRSSGSSGFDTRGPLSGQILTPPPPSPPTPVEFREKSIVPEKVSPEIRALLDEREELRGRRNEMQQSLERLESKGSLSPEESAVLRSLQQELSVILNKENFLNFAINESLP
jgi:small-conductance mechanosensitive channel